jgi:hypothetical protein
MLDRLAKKLVRAQIHEAHVFFWVFRTSCGRFWPISGHPALLRMRGKRHRGYRAMGYRVEARREIGEISAVTMTCP